MGEKLKLRCEDEEDVVVLSSLLQDALVPMAELAWLPAEKCFVFVASRFIWSECIEVTLPAGEAPSGVLAEMTAPDGSLTIAPPLAADTTSASRKFVSPMKLATKRSAGRS